MKENESAITDELIVRYLAGEASPEEAMAVQDALTDLKFQSHFAALQSTWAAAHPGKTTRNVYAAEAWLAIEDQLTRRRLEKVKASPDEKQTRALRYSHRVFRIAASLLLLAVAGVVLYKVLLSQGSDEMLTYVTTQGRVQHVDLPDQSVATVFRNSKLSYAADFNSHHREVSLLEGEVFFNVTHDRKHPFIIHTAVADIKVIGTAFNVTLKGDAVEVSVKEGKVQVYTKTDSTFLEAGVTGVAQKAGLIQTEDSVNSNTWGYATHRFVFKDTPLREVIRDLEKAYPYTIQVSDQAINNCRLTATFENDSAENLLNLMAESLNLSVTSSGGVYTLEGEGCP
ncbi:MAG TPA: FecR domain-containing protein [Chryseolinea sp.]